MKILKAPIAQDSKFLVYALVFTILCHGAAMLSMLAFLLPGMPGGTSDIAHRVSYISDHVLLWRLGWFPWQMTALSDLILAVALVKTSWIPRPAAMASLALTIIAIAVEQPAEFRWVTSGVDLAQQSMRTENFSLYLALENDVFSLTSHWAALFYTLAAIFWSICLAKGGAWNTFMNRLSILLWSMLIVVSVGPLLTSKLGPQVVSVGNAISFNLMMIWFVGALLLVKMKPLTSGKGELNG